MTEAELLAKLATTPHWDPHGTYMHKALIQVLTLHSYDAEWDLCMVCDLGPYPCPTVEAVTKGLTDV